MYFLWSNINIFPILGNPGVYTLSLESLRNSNGWVLPLGVRGCIFPCKNLNVWMIYTELRKPVQMRLLSNCTAVLKWCETGVFLLILFLIFLLFLTDSYKGKLSSNIKTVTWLPQNDILGHPKTRLFMTHSGINGISESAYHGVPMVCSPFFADQMDNSQRMKDHGMAEIMSVRTATTEQLVQVLNKVLNDER